MTLLDGRVLVATGHDDGAVRVWVMGEGLLAEQPAGHDGAVRSLAFALRRAGAPVLATGSADKTVRVWDPLEGGAAKATFNGQNSVWSVALTTLPDDRMLLASGGENTIRLWDIDHESPSPRRLTGHSDPVRSIAFTTGADGDVQLISGSDDGTVRLWDTVTCKQFGNNLVGHDGAVLAIGSIPGKAGVPLIISGGEDGAIQIWAPPGAFPVSDGVGTVAAAPVPTRTNVPAARDDTATEDLLDRSILAGHLYVQLECLTSGRKVNDGSRGTAVVHIEGPWGAGKTTLVNLLHARRRCSSSNEAQDRSTLADAVVVEYDAWRESVVAPEWWSLATAINRAVRGERAGITRAVMSVLGTAARVMSSRPVLVAVALLLGVMTAHVVGMWRQASEVSGLVTVLTAVAAIGLSAGRVLFWTSPAFGKLYVKSDGNPLGDIAKIIERLRRWTPRQRRRHRMADTLAALCGLAALVVAGRLAFETEAPRLVAARDWLLGRWSLVLLVLVAIIIVWTSWPRRITPDDSPADEATRKGGDSDSSPADRLARFAKTRPWLAIAVRVASVVGACALVWVTWVAPLPGWTLQHPIISAVVLFAVVVGGHVIWTSRGIVRERRPVVLVIDDLDRCTVERAVKLLETVHTLLRERTEVRIFRLWRTPAPLIVLVPADGRWIRAAFESTYQTFSSLGSEVHGLGADFLQKLFDHTVLVPALTSEQVRRLVKVVTGTPDESTEIVAGQAKKEALDFIDRRDPGLLRTRDTNIKLFAEPLTRKEAAEVEQRRVEREAGPIATAKRVEHLLDKYVHLMPANPRLIKRVANMWGMLSAVQGHLHVGQWRDVPPDDHIMRAAIMFIRFPRLVDELLSCPTPPKAERRTTYPSTDASSPWQRPDVQELLTNKYGERISSEEIARCYGRTFPPEQFRQ